VTSPTALVMTGRGGQGGKLAMELLAWSASAQGLVPVLYNVYGALIRGGDIASSLVVAKTDPSLAICDSFDVMCALHNSWFERYYTLLGPNGLLIADEEALDASAFVRGHVEHLRVSFGRLAAESGDRRASNMVATGILAAISGVGSRDALREGMTAAVPAHRADRIEKNLAAVEHGYSFAEGRHLVPPAGPAPSRGT
jgi:Pyruvate/2-oxoacid:ferredoxin oxidoreductase gamma subunit